MSVHKGVATVSVAGKTYYIVSSQTERDRAVYVALTFAEFGGDRIIAGQRCKRLGSGTSLLEAFQVIAGLHPGA